MRPMCSAANGAEHGEDETWGRRRTPETARRRLGKNESLLAARNQRPSLRMELHSWAERAGSGGERGTKRVLSQAIRALLSRCAA